LLGKFRNSESSVLLGPTASQGSKTRHEEVKAREGNHVDRKFAKIGVELTRESKAGSDSTHGGRDKVVEVAISRGGELECAEADVIKCLIVDTIGLVSVLN